MPDTTLQVQAALSDHIPASAQWQVLSGGRTNRVWRVRWAEQDCVCKLYRGADDNPLFPNDPDAEYRCLQVMALRGLAPAPVSFHQAPAGTILIYRFDNAPHWQGDYSAIGRVLARVHASPPIAGLRSLVQGSDAVLAQARAMLAEVPGKDARALMKREPVVAPLAPVAPCFLHGDVVPANVLGRDETIRLIDWQCPGLGDPVDDLACFLSPAMQTVYGSGPLSPAATDAVLRGYDSPRLSERYHLVIPAYHYRMAAYCLWRVARGHNDYQAAYEAELAALRSGDL